MKLSSLVFIKTLYDYDNNISNIFGTFVLQVLEDNFLGLEKIQEKIYSTFSIDIPQITIKNLINKIHSETQYIEIDEKKNGKFMTKIKKKGKETIYKFKEEEKKSKRETNSLINSIHIFIKNNYSEEFSKDEIMIELNKFLETQIDEASCILLGNYKEIDSDKKKIEKINMNLGNYLIEYIKETEKSDQENFERLKNLLFGNILSSVIVRKNIDIKKAKTPKLNIYLDTNMVFYILGFADEDILTAINDLLKLLPSYNCKLKIFSFTKEEIIEALDGCILNYEKGIGHIDIEYLGHILKKKGYKKSDIYLIQSNLDNLLKKHHIEIDHKDINFNKNSKHINKLIEFSGNKKSKFGATHDMAAINWIKKIRGKQSRKIESTNSIFLTTDKNLFRFNKKKHIRTIPECILYPAFTNILWLKNPNIQNKLPIYNIIATLKQELIIKREVWDTFIQELNNNNKLTDEEINNLISHIQTKEFLTQINGDSNEEIIEKSKKFIDEKIKNINENNNSSYNTIEKEGKKYVKNRINKFLIRSFITISIIFILLINAFSDIKLLFLDINGFRNTVLNNLGILGFLISFYSIIIIIFISFILRSENGLKISLGFTEFNTNFLNKLIIEYEKNKTQEYIEKNTKNID